MITVRLSGGIGNQMFQYAFGRALSLKYGVSLALDLTFLNHRVKMPNILRPNFVFRTFDLDVFNIDAKIAQPTDISFWNRPFFKGWPMIVIDAILRKLAFLPGWEKRFSFNEEILKLGPNAYLQGFWQSENYFSNIASTIRNDFTLKKPISKISMELLEKIKKTESLCIHLRRTHGGGSFHKKYNMDYYENGIKYIEKEREIDKIYVFSDDISWCKNNLSFSYPTMFVDSEYAGRKGEEHLYLMSMCKYFIIPNSTFSWWGAWLSTRKDKIVIVPQKWYKNESIKIDDLIPKEWIKI